ncbi:D-alanine--D-alanine ligase [Bernardetia sp.]|uniref:D-alanine--D-alanine ligase family protein n=1 Tax=Bernardetia sp. TaxID=1937974 RepID=UPI0025C26C57|nr:D-alanine--D-alanine ligase [Bernardetia sp.]
MIKIGIFFGGVSREREISFAGAKTVSQIINHSLFEPVYILIDSLGKFIKINPVHFQHKAISHFYPTQDSIPEEYDEFSPVYIETLEELTNEKHRKIMEEIGTPIPTESLSDYVDFALLMLHGTFAEDGMLQGLFEWLQIPYSGCGIFPSSFSIDKHLQQVINEKLILGDARKYHMMRKDDWRKCNQEEVFEGLKAKLGLPIVIKAPYQGSSIGVSILKADNLQEFIKAVNSSLFARQISKQEWTGLSMPQRKEYINVLMSLEKGIGLPVVFEERSLLGGNLGEQIIYSPIKLIEKLNDFFSYSDEDAMLFSFESEDMVLFEQHLSGKEFSCGVIQDENLNAVALPPTEIITTTKVYDFEAKYLPNASQKRIPIDIPTDKIIKIQERCKSIFQTFKFDACARIDGFYTDEDTIEIIDINTLPGMSPTSLIFRQAAEIGFSPTDFMTYLIYQSLNCRVHTAKRPYFFRQLLKKLQGELVDTSYQNKEKVAIFFDANTFEEARKEFNIISSEGEKQPFCVFLKVEEEKSSLYKLPVSFLLKPNIEEVIQNLDTELHPAITHTIKNAKELTDFFVKDFVASPQKITLENLNDMVKDVVWLIKSVDNEDAPQSKIKRQLYEIGMAVVS